MNNKTSFVMYNEYLDDLEELSMEQRGLLITMTLQYSNFGEFEQANDLAVRQTFRHWRRRIDADSLKWRDTCQKRKEAGKKGGEAKAEKYNQSRNKGKQDMANIANATFARKDLANVADNESVNVNVSDNVNDNENESETYKAFVPPALEEVQLYCEQYAPTIDASRFFSYYQGRGWKTGGNPIYDWKAVLESWKSNNIAKEGKAKALYNQIPVHGDTDPPF